MITYDTGKWGIWFAFSCVGSVFPTSLVIAAPCAIGSGVLRYMMHELFPDIGKATSFSGVGATTLGGFTFVLGFLIVFRSQQAFSRWWEGGTILQQLRGEWFNAYSSMMAFCNGSPEKKQEVLEFQHQLARLISLLFASGLSQVATMDRKELELIALDGFDEESINFLKETHDQCEVVLQWIQRLIVYANDSGVLKIAPPILSRVYNQLGNGIVALNNARKITEFAIPFNLAQMITIMLIVHTILTTCITALVAADSFIATFITFVVTFSFWSVNFIATELEMPYGDDANDLPLIEMQVDLNQSLVSLFEERAREPPRFLFNHESHKQLTRGIVDMRDDLFTFIGEPQKIASSDEVKIPVPSPSPAPKSPPSAVSGSVSSKIHPEEAPHQDASRATPMPTMTALDVISWELVSVNTAMESHLQRIAKDMQLLARVPSNLVSPWCTEGPIDLCEADATLQQLEQELVKEDVLRSTAEGRNNAATAQSAQSESAAVASPVIGSVPGSAGVLATVSHESSALPEADQCKPQIAGDVSRGAGQEIVRLSTLMVNHLSQIGDVMHHSAVKTLTSLRRSAREGERVVI